jgi:peptidoglycan/LPS O-acetylase OafA/YrhL
LITTRVLGWWLLPPYLYKEFGLGVTAVSAFASNILFYRTTNYFSQAADENPLLHTWSLSVEKQFYFLFPCFLSLIWKFSRLRIHFVIFAVLLLSLFLSDWMSRHYEVANFYSLPTRAWEFMVGSLIAVLSSKFDQKGNDFLAFAGLLIVLTCLFMMIAYECQAFSLYCQ